MAIEHEGIPRKGGVEIDFDDPEYMYKGIIDFKEYVVDQDSSHLATPALDWPQCMSRTLLDGRFLDREETDIILNGNPHDESIVFESALTPVYVCHDHLSLAMSVYDYYARVGIERLQPILKEWDLKTERSDDNMLSIYSKSGRINVSFGSKPDSSDTAAPKRAVFPGTIEFKGLATERQQIIVQLVTRNGGRVLVDSQVVLQHALTNYSELYEALLNALYEERGLQHFPVGIFFGSPNE
jgi:hypothetical protein